MIRGLRSKIGPDGEIDREWEGHHIRFHDALVAECGMPKLMGFRTILDLQARRYRRIAVHYLTSPRDDLAEHRAIRDAVLDRGIAQSGRMIREHFLRTADIILTKQIG